MAGKVSNQDPYLDWSVHRGMAQRGGSAPDVTWASANNLQDLVAPPDLGPQDNGDTDTDGDRDTNKPGTYDFLKYNERHLTSEVLFCASMGNLRRLKMVLKRAKKTITSETFQDYDQRTPLHIAASDGSVMVTNWLIEQGVDMNPIDRWGMTPLEGAAFGHQDIIAMIKGRRLEGDAWAAHPHRGVPRRRRDGERQAGVHC